MAMDEWTQLVQRVDTLINELRAAKAEAKKWRARAVELERLKGKDDRTILLESQYKERELERYRKERKKIITMVAKLITELEQAQLQVLEKTQNE